MNKKHNRFGGDHRGGDFAHRDSNRPAFHGNNRGGRDGGGRSGEMFQAICASCGKPCEVPFRPNGKKPVYCNTCFAQNGGPSSDGRVSTERFAPRRDYSPAPSYKPEYKKETPNTGMAELSRQIESINTKLEKLINTLSEKRSEVSEAPKAIAKKKVAKKAAPKKKK